MSERQAFLLIGDMIQAIERIFEYVEGFDFISFQKDYKTIDAVTRNFEIIGEAANRLPDDFKLTHSDIPWKEIRGLRNRLVHDYIGTDLSILWEVIHNYLPDLHKKLIPLQTKF